VTNQSSLHCQTMFALHPKADINSKR